MNSVHKLRKEPITPMIVPPNVRKQFKYTNHDIAINDSVPAGKPEVASRTSATRPKTLRVDGTTYMTAPLCIVEEDATSYTGLLAALVLVAIVVLRLIPKLAPFFLDILVPERKVHRRAAFEDKIEHQLADLSDEVKKLKQQIDAQ